MVTLDALKVMSPSMDASNGLLIVPTLLNRCKICKTGKKNKQGCIDPSYLTLKCVVISGHQ